MALVRHRNATDGVMRIAFDNGAIVMSALRTCTEIADTGDSDAADREPGGRDADDFTAVAGRVV